MQQSVTTGWVPEDQRTTAWYIWNELYMCAVPYIQLITDVDLEHFGMPSSGISSFDMGTAEEVRTVMIPISRMVELFKNGARISVCHEEDTKKIYDRISAHLELWKDHLIHSLNITDAPIDDLKAMDEFANKVYIHARYHMGNDFFESLFSKLNGDYTRSLSGLIDGLNTAAVSLNKPQVSSTSNVKISDPDGVFKSKQAKPQEPVEDTSDDDKYPQRQSMVDFFDGFKLNPRPVKGSRVNNGKEAIGPSSFSDLLRNKK